MEYFENLCYNLYKIDWMRRITPERQMDAIKDWYETTAEEDKSTYTFDDFIEDEGYQGELYVCKDEFLGAEFLDSEYMKELLNNENLYKTYEKYMEKINSGYEK